VGSSPPPIHGTGAQDGNVLMSFLVLLSLFIWDFVLPTPICMFAVNFFASIQETKLLDA
jgi:hypothetical protein